jgi:hypothetical protein
VYTPGVPTMVHEHGVVKQLVGLITQSFEMDVDVAVLRNAAAALRNIAMHDGSTKVGSAVTGGRMSGSGTLVSTRQQMVDEGAVWPLVQLCVQEDSVRSSMDMRLIGYASGALAQLSRAKASRPELVRCAASSTMVQLCAKVQDGGVLASCAEVLSQVRTMLVCCGV